MKKATFLILLIGIAINISAQEIKYKTETDIHYYKDEVNKKDKYIDQYCTLDIYYPKDKKGVATIVWFHGGGLTEGSKEIPEQLKEQGMCIVGVGYRLTPKVDGIDCIKDAVASLAWVFSNISNYGGDTSLIFVSGHSAGGYLTSMIGLDKRWLKNYNINANRIAGLIPLSGQMITHFTIRKERGLKNTQPVIDEFAPLFYVRPDASPFIMITGDRELELLGRYEENAYMMRMMKIVGHQQARLYELQGYDHNMTAPAFPLLLKEVKRICEEKKLMK